MRGINEQNNSGSSTSPDANPIEGTGIQPKAECTCTDKWLDPYCKYHTAQHDFLRESGAFDLTVGEALPNNNAPQSAETPAAIPSPGVDKDSKAVNWAVHQLDDLEQHWPESDDDMEMFVGWKAWKHIRNSLRDRYKAETGIDPSPNYNPGTAALSPHSEPQEAITDPMPSVTIEQILADFELPNKDGGIDVDEAINQIQTLITQARIDELKKAKQAGIVNDNIDIWVDNRINKLKEGL